MPAQKEGAAPPTLLISFACAHSKFVSGVVVVIVPVSFVSVIGSFCGMMQSTDTPVDEFLLHSVDQILSNPKGKEYLLSKIGLSSSDVETHRSGDNCRLTPSGMSAGVWDTWPRGWPPFWPHGMPPFQWGSTFCL